MRLNNKNISLLFLILVFTACDLKESNEFFIDNTDSLETKNNNTESPFKLYLRETFGQKKLDKDYIVIVGKRICKLCEDGVFLQFQKKQKIIDSKKIMIITDFEQINSLLAENFKPNIVFDSSSNFENYTFPRSYITIYKLNNGNIVNYSHFSDEAELTKFLKEENLLVSVNH